MNGGALGNGDGEGMRKFSRWQRADCPPPHTCCLPCAQQSLDPQGLSEETDTAQRVRSGDERIVGAEEEGGWVCEN